MLPWMVACTLTNDRDSDMSFPLFCDQQLNVYVKVHVFDHKEHCLLSPFSTRRK